MLLYLASFAQCDAWEISPRCLRAPLEGGSLSLTCKKASGMSCWVPAPLLFLLCVLQASLSQPGAPT